MKKKEVWIEQARETREPWAIHAVLTKERRKVDASGEIFADWIPNPERKFKIMPVTITDAAFPFTSQVRNAVEGMGHAFTRGDETQINTALAEAKSSFNAY